MLDFLQNLFNSNQPNTLQPGLQNAPNSTLANILNLPNASNNPTVAPPYDPNKIGAISSQPQQNSTSPMLSNLRQSLILQALNQGLGQSQTATPPPVQPIAYRPSGIASMQTNPMQVIPMVFSRNHYLGQG
jgi:hypothetical protein